METTTEVDLILEQLREAGELRANSSRHTLAGLQDLHRAYEDIRAYSTEARRLKVTWPKIAEVVGVSRAQLHNIVTGKTKA